jgi:hypothetical protein
MPPDRALVVMPAAGSWRRALVPSAWLVLEELAVGASQDGELSTNVRQLGAGLELSKDTAARPLRRLIAAGLVQRVEDRHGATGRFGSVVYRVDRAEAGLTITDPRTIISAAAAVDLERRLVPNESRPPASTARSPRPTRPAASTSSTEQLDLFDSRS